MILLDKSKYENAANPLKSVKINNLFARSVIEKNIDGTVYVDSIEKPETFYVIHPYGMSLLFGDTDNEDFNSHLIDYCMENNYEPIWSCRLENTGAYKLAQKLGFEPVLYIPFYRLNA